MMVMVVAAGAGSRTGSLVAGFARRRGHYVRSLASLDDARGKLVLTVPP
jgi:hypothetical protein